jgi:hypothetical protein
VALAASRAVITPFLLRSKTEASVCNGDSDVRSQETILSQRSVLYRLDAHSRNLEVP